MLSLKLHTLEAEDTSIFIMETVMISPAIVWTLEQAAFISAAFHVIQKNCSRTFTEEPQSVSSAMVVTQMPADHPGVKRYQGSYQWIKNIRHELFACVLSALLKAETTTRVR